MILGLPWLSWLLVLAAPAAALGLVLPFWAAHRNERDDGAGER